MFKVHTFESQTNVPHILILGAVHGNEIAGTLASQALIQQFQQGQLTLLRGQATFIPIVNELAQQQDTRFVDENLNRVITTHTAPMTHEQKIANQLLSYIEKADVLLDLHSTHCKDDEAFAFIDYPSEKNLDFLRQKTSIYSLLNFYFVFIVQLDINSKIIPKIGDNKRKSSAHNNNRARREREFQDGRIRNNAG